LDTTPVFWLLLADTELPLLPPWPPAPPPEPPPLPPAAEAAPLVTDAAKEASPGTALIWKVRASVW
jgi:hypothetical protein